MTMTTPTYAHAARLALLYRDKADDTGFVWTGDTDEETSIQIGLVDEVGLADLEALDEVRDDLILGGVLVRAERMHIVSGRRITGWKVLR